MKISVADKESKPESTRVFNDKNKVIVNCLSWDTTSESLLAALSQYGEVEECKVGNVGNINARFSMIVIPRSLVVVLLLVSRMKRT